MIITRAPLRITLGGAPTDLDSYSRKYGGFCISATINKYCYVAINRTFQEEIVLKYSSMEKVKTVDEIQHPILREAIRNFDFKTPQLEVVSVADVPSNGAGLGNSGAFTVALLHALAQHRHISLSTKNIAEMACNLNIDILKKNQGRQDEYASAFGGLNKFFFDPSGDVRVAPIKISHEKMIELEDNLLLFYTGMAHNTEEILKEQNEKTNEDDQSMILNLELCKQTGVRSMKALEEGNLDDFGKWLNFQWELKEKRSLKTTNVNLQYIHNALNINGAIGNKIVGSGGGGFFLVYAYDKGKVRDYMKYQGMEEMRFQFDFEGVKRLV